MWSLPSTEVITLNTSSPSIITLATSLPIKEDLYVEMSVKYDVPELPMQRYIEGHIKESVTSYLVSSRKRIMIALGHQRPDPDLAPSGSHSESCVMQQTPRTWSWRQSLA